ncbi:hypothetical protein [Otoolea muris]|nr:hypothetical protein [Otoolea muris]
MPNEKKELIIRSIDDYKKLSEKDKMYILGYMYRALMDCESNKMQ